MPRRRENKIFSADVQTAADRPEQPREGRPGHALSLWLARAQEVSELSMNDGTPLGAICCNYPYLYIIVKGCGRVFLKDVGAIALSSFPARVSSTGKNRNSREITASIVSRVKAAVRVVREQSSQLHGSQPLEDFTIADAASPGHFIRGEGMRFPFHPDIRRRELLRHLGAERRHRQFWNHSGASLLVLVTDDHINIYSGMTRPVPATDTTAELPSLVESLDRLPDGLREFIVAVESGEFFHRHQPSFDPKQRVDRHLLDNLQSTREKLDTVDRKKIPDLVLDSLLCRLVFTCYLFDRNIIGKKYLADLKIRWASDLRDLLSNPSPSKAKNALYRLFEKLKEDFNGDLFSNDLGAEKELIQDQHITTLNSFFQGTEVRTGQGTLFRLYDFKFIPIETISAIYERFLKDKQKGAFYTPRFLAEVVLDTALDGTKTLIGKRFLDPLCA
jgi:hypothetical protein